MSMHEETKNSAISAKEVSPNSDKAVLTHTQNPVDFLIVTKMPQKTYKFQWIIRQFSTLPRNKEVYSTDIHTSSTSSYRLKLVKYTHGFGLFHDDKMQASKTNIEKKTTTIEYAFNAQPRSMFGSPANTTECIEPNKVSNTNDFHLKLDYQISAIDSKGKELMKWLVCLSDVSEFSSCKIGEYMNNILEIFPDDLLILDCQLEVILTPITEEIPVASKPSLGCNSWKKFSTDMKSLYQNSLETDVTLIVGTEKIRTHKLILTARSPVFRTIFSHDMEEAEQNSVNITDVQFSALLRLVEFLYSGVIENGENKDLSLQELFDLYYAADKYEVMDLREMVGNTLLGRIEIDNASEVLVWADRHSDKDMKFRIMNFIRLNSEDVFDTDTWESCARHHRRLAIEVFSFCSKKHKGLLKKL